MKRLETVLNDDQHAELLAILERSKQTSYAFVKEAVLKEMRAFQEVGGSQGPSLLVQQMIEILSKRKRFIYQMGAYSDQNHQKWIAGRFPQATRREVLEAVATFRKTGGIT